MVATDPDHEVIIVGAGVCGIYQLYRLLELGVDTTLIEAGDDLGGTWFWNRYPGARFDSESISYGYSFSPDLLQEWDWKERFSGQPENLRYLSYVAEKFDLRPHMQFGCSVESAHFDDAATLWRLHLGDGRDLSCHFLVLAIGLLSAPTMPRYEGMDEFRGPSFHTYNWPTELLDLPDKRVAVIGTGATGVQVIGELADKVRQLTVFQRRPNWCAPLHNGEISPQEMAEIKTALRRDLRHLRPHTGRLPPRARPTAVLRGAARGAAGEVGAAVRRARVRHLAGELPRHLHGRGGQRRAVRVHRRQDPLTRP